MAFRNTSNPKIIPQIMFREEYKNLTVNEVKKSLQQIIKLVQLESFKREIDYIMLNREYYFKNFKYAFG